ncbi:MAG: glycosyltransferase family 4 protein [Dehalococcoidales bacterium]|nr:MAG: glycosyltransferase family 4 protein [Dehalococcoidales bacterium]
MAVLIVTTEKSGIDKYSQELGKRLDIKQIQTRRYLSLAEGFRLERLVRRQDDIVHLPNQNFARYAMYSRNPFIVTVHDMIRFCFGFDQETVTEKLMLKLDMRCIRRASHIITVSQRTKKDLIEHLRIPEAKISVIHNGIDHSVLRPGAVRAMEKPYILYVGSERPRKNLTRLVEAFALLKKEFPGLKLVKVGEPGRSREYRRSLMMKLDSLGITGDVIFTDHASEQELAAYYSSAVLLAYPSLYEGFGLPPLEAMACGCPVVASKVASLPEVVGDAGILIDPYDVDELARAMREVITDDRLREDMVARGLKQASRFSWEKTASQTQAVYNKVYNEAYNKVPVSQAV